MRQFGTAGDRFLQTLTTEIGSEFRGAVIPVSDQQGSAIDFSAPRLILRVRGEALVKSADVIQTDSGARFIVADHFEAEAGWRAYKLFSAERQMVWKRPSRAVDVLTGLAKAAGAPTTVGNVWVTDELARRQFSDPGLKVPIERTVIITNSPVLPNDTLDGKSVTRVNQELGLYILEIH